MTLVYTGLFHDSTLVALKKKKVCCRTGDDDRLSYASSPFLRLWVVHLCADP